MSQHILVLYMLQPTIILDVYLSGQRENCLIGEKVMEMHVQ